jgi:hypothetical protein
MARSAFLEARRDGRWRTPSASPVVSDAGLALKHGRTKREIRLLRQDALLRRRGVRA